MTYRFGFVLLLVLTLRVFTTDADADVSIISHDWQVYLERDAGKIDSCLLTFNLSGGALSSVTGSCSRNDHSSGQFTLYPSSASGAFPLTVCSRTDNGTPPRTLHTFRFTKGGVSVVGSERRPLRFHLAPTPPSGRRPIGSTTTRHAAP